MTSDIHNPDGNLLAMRIIESIAEAKGRDPSDLDPLHDTVPTECLSELFPPPSELSADAIRQFTFTYEDHIVNISKEGTVEVFPKGGQTPDLSPTDATSPTSQGEPEAPD